MRSLDELERAAHDGRLGRVAGMGPKRLRGIREALAGRFRCPVGGPVADPPVKAVLAVNAAYQDQVSP